MKEIFELIEKIFGTAFLRLTTIGIILYFGISGIVKFIENAKKLSSSKKALERERISLELLKLRYEIEALKKEHQLDDLTEYSKETPAPEIMNREFMPKKSNKLAMFLVKKGLVGRILFFLITTFLQLIGTMSFAISLAFLFDVLTGKYTDIKKSDIYMISILLTFFIASVYFGFIRFGKVLNNHSKRGGLIVRGLAIITGLTVFVIIIYIQ